GLPGPVKAVIASIGGIAGATALVAGAFLTLGPRIVATIDAMERLGVSVSKSGLLIRAGAAAAAAGFAALAAATADSNKTVSEIANAGVMAAVGSAVGGPWGGAMRGGIGLMKAFGSTAMYARGSVDALTATLDEQTGAVTANSGAWVAKQLVD